MLFIRCKGGVSHNPAESVEGADAALAVCAMAAFIEKLAAAQAIRRKLSA
jgi:allantoate deiminase